jgi:hypothetical protein
MSKLTFQFQADEVIIPPPHGWDRLFVATAVAIIGVVAWFTWPDALGHLRAELLSLPISW